MENDTLQRFLFEEASVRGEIVHLKQSFQTIVHQHQYPLLIQQLLGEALVLVTLLSAIIKFKGRLTIQFQCKNKLKLLLAQCNNELHIRGLAEWVGELDEIELASSLREGILAIIMDPDTSTQRYQGMVAWQNNSLAHSIEGYFKNSEQLPTRIWVAVNETCASGLLLQVIPRKGDKGHDGPISENDPDWEHLTHLTSTITQDELLTLDNETLLYRLYSQESVRVFDSEPVLFRCTCSRQRSENAIQLLGQEEAEDELRQNQVLVVKCEFCNQEFIFDRVDVKRIFHGGSDNVPPGEQLH